MMFLCMQASFISFLTHFKIISNALIGKCPQGFGTYFLSGAGC
jgi:hypothetical protein